MKSLLKYAEAPDKGSPLSNLPTVVGAKEGFERWARIMAKRKGYMIRLFPEKGDSPNQN